MGQAEDAWFLTMEYLDGHDLATYLNGNHARVSRGVDATDSVATLACTAGEFGPRVLLTFRQLARGIKALHDAGMLHRDLKPNNVLVVEQRVVVLDFGLMRELDVSAATLTEAGVAAGTPAYMAPEQIMAKPLTAASDWYAFGVMLYEAISGLLPFEGPVMQLLNAKLTSEPVALRALRPARVVGALHLVVRPVARRPVSGSRPRLCARNG
jgi:serine/threonine protein kinase